MQKPRDGCLDIGYFLVRESARFARHLTSERQLGVWVTILLLMGPACRMNAQEIPGELAKFLKEDRELRTSFRSVDKETSRRWTSELQCKTVGAAIDSRKSAGMRLPLLNGATDCRRILLDYCIAISQRQQGLTEYNDKKTPHA